MKNTLLAIALALSSCSIPFYGVAALSGGYARTEVTKTPIEPFEEKISTLAFNARKLLFRCEISKTASAAQVTTTTTRFRPNVKLAAASVGLLELMGSLIVFGLDQGDEIDLPPAAQTALIVAAIDGLALSSAIVIPTRSTSTQSTEPATPEIINGCPLGTEMAINGERYPLYSNGTTSPEAELAFAGVMSTPDKSFRVISKQQSIEVTPTTEDRCRWARAQEQASLPSFCPQLALPLPIPNLSTFRIRGDNVEIVIRIR